MVGTVTIACKLPNGIIIDEQKMVETQEMVMGGGTRAVHVAQKTGRRAVINGVAAPYGHDRRDATGAAVPIHSAFALTYGVDADVWANWLSFNQNSAMVLNGMIFANAKAGEVQAEARARETIRSGMEPMDQVSDPRSPRKAQKVAEGLGISELTVASKAA
jgi:hypothetical protein